MPVRRAVVEDITPEALMKMINKKYGPKTMRMASDPHFQIERIPTGILSVDVRLGGGFPRNRHVEIYGGWSVGKTYLAYRSIASAQALGLRCCFVDIERTFNPTFAELAGVDLDSLAMPEAEHGNMAIDLMETFLRSGIYDIIVLDSIAALLPKAELESTLEAGSMGTEQARLMSKALRKLTAANKKTVLIYINQTREAIGVTFGKRSVTSGGKAMGFYSGIRLELVRTENIKRKGRQIDPAKGDEKVVDLVRGHRVLLRVEKDKSGGTQQGSTTSFVFDYELNGVDHVEDLMYLGRTYNFVMKSGMKWWMEGYEDEMQTGRANFKKWLRRNTAVQEELETMIREAAETTEPEEEIEEDD